MRMANQRDRSMLCSTRFTVLVFGAIWALYVYLFMPRADSTSSLRGAGGAGTGGSGRAREGRTVGGREAIPLPSALDDHDQRPGMDGGNVAGDDASASSLLASSSSSSVDDGARRGAVRHGEAANREGVPRSTSAPDGAVDNRAEIPDDDGAALVAEVLRDSPDEDKGERREWAEHVGRNFCRALHANV